MRLSEDVGYLLSRASGQAVRSANAALAGHGLRVRQYSVLALATDAAGGLSQRELAEELGLDPSQVVALVDELAAAGLVERRPSPTDRRTRLVGATAAGRRVRQQAEQSAAAAQRERLSVLSEEERRTLRSLLQRVIAGPGTPEVDVAS